MTPFPIAGDRLKCIEGDATLGLVRGDVYTVASATNSDGRRWVTLEGVRSPVPTGWHASRFIMETPVKAGGWAYVSEGLASAQAIIDRGLTPDGPDIVKMPQHYRNHPSGVECITITKHMNFCRGNAIKYVWRAGEKGGKDKEIEDLRKARQYLDIEIERLENVK